MFYILLGILGKLLFWIWCDTCKKVCSTNKYNPLDICYSVKLTWPKTKEMMRKATVTTEAKRRKERNNECWSRFQYVTYTLSKSPLPFSSFPIAKKLGVFFGYFSVSLFDLLLIILIRRKSAMSIYIYGFVGYTTPLCHWRALLNSPNIFLRVSSKMLCRLLEGRRCYDYLFLFFRYPYHNPTQKWVGLYFVPVTF